MKAQDKGCIVDRHSCLQSIHHEYMTSTPSYYFLPETVVARWQWFDTNQKWQILLTRHFIRQIRYICDQPCLITITITGSLLLITVKLIRTTAIWNNPINSFSKWLFYGNVETLQTCKGLWDVIISWQLELLRWGPSLPHLCRRTLLTSTQPPPLAPRFKKIFFIRNVFTSSHGELAYALWQSSSCSTLH